MRSRPGNRLRPAHFSVWTPSGAAVPEQQAPALVAPKGLQTQESYFAGRSPKLAGPLPQTQTLLAAPTHRSTAPPFFSLLRTPAVPPLLALPQIDHPTGLLFPRATALLQLEHPTPLLPPVGIASRGNAGLHPGPPHTPAASRRTPCAAATPHGAFKLAQRLPPTWPVPGKKPKPAPEPVRSPQKPATHFGNNPPRSRDLCPSELRER